MFLFIGSLATAQIPGEISCEQAENFANIKRLVDQAAKDFKAQQDQTIEAINQKDPKYRNKNLFVFVYDDTKVIAHGRNDRLIGRDLKGAKDAARLPFIISLKRMAIEKGEGCIKYQWLRPDKSGAIDDKIGYARRINGRIWMGSGTAL